MEFFNALMDFIEQSGASEHIFELLVVGVIGGIMVRLRAGNREALQRAEARTIELQAQAERQKLDNQNKEIELDMQRRFIEIERRQAVLFDRERERGDKLQQELNEQMRLAQQQATRITELALTAERARETADRQQEHLNDMEVQHKSAVAELREQYEARIKQHAQNINDLNKRVDELTEQVGKLTDTINERELEIARLRRERDTANTEVARLTLEVETLSNKIENMTIITKGELGNAA